MEVTAAALVAAEPGQALVLVEGVSDQVAVETLAERMGRNLASERVVVVPIGGAQAVGRYLRRFGPRGAGVALAGLCDAGEEEYFRRGLAGAGLGSPTTRLEMERLGFFVCVDDLEDELIRASGQEMIEELLHAQGDLPAFRTFQKQPEWRQAPFEAQMHRFLGAGARRKLRYARLLVGAVELGRMPRPLTEVLRRTRPSM